MSVPEVFTNLREARNHFVSLNTKLCKEACKTYGYKYVGMTSTYLIHTIWNNMSKDQQSSTACHNTAILCYVLPPGVTTPPPEGYVIPNWFQSYVNSIGGQIDDRKRSKKIIHDELKSMTKSQMIKEIISLREKNEILQTSMNKWVDGGISPSTSPQL